MANGKITKELKNLGLTINGKEPTGDTISEVINGIDNDFENGNIATKDYVDTLMSGALKRAIVETLPTENIDTNTIYMVLDETASSGNVYNEYLYINNAWELIGTTATSGGLLSEIVDGNGNARFVEGTGTTSGEITSTYCKWSLSGTHIMFVCAGSKNAGTISDGLIFATFTVPNWVLDKIVPTYIKIVETKPINFIDYSNGTLTPATFNLRKNVDKIDIQLNGTVTLTEGNVFRIQFDLLIDTD